MELKWVYLQQEHPQPDHVRQRAVIDAERVRTQLRQAANKSGDADEPCAQGRKQRRLAAPVR